MGTQEFPAIPGSISKTGSGSVEAAREPTKLLSKIKETFGKTKEVSQAVILAVGIILGYSWGATESLARGGRMMIYDVIEATKLAQIPTISIARASTPKIQAAKVVQEKRQLVDEIIVTKPVTRNEGSSEKLRQGSSEKPKVTDMIAPPVAANDKSLSPISFESLKKISLKVQEDLGIGWAKIHTQEQASGRCKIWLTYAGRTSTAFFSTTPKHAARLTQEGMKTWAKEKIQYLTLVDAIEKVAIKNAIVLKNGIHSAVGESSEFSLKVSEGEKSRKIRFLLSRLDHGNIIEGSTIDFTMKMNDITEATLQRDFDITKARAYDQLG